MEFITLHVDYMLKNVFNIIVYFLFLYQSIKLKHTYSCKLQNQKLLNFQYVNNDTFFLYKSTDICKSRYWSKTGSKAFCAGTYYIWIPIRSPKYAVTFYILFENEEISKQRDEFSCGLNFKLKTLLLIQPL